MREGDRPGLETLPCVYWVGVPSILYNAARAKTKVKNEKITPYGVALCTKKQLVLQVCCSCALIVGCMTLQNHVFSGFSLAGKLVKTAAGARDCCGVFHICVDGF